ncbi:MAG: 3-hydroxyacyl-CoA dehydrogenase NAD-binding domain-containing protein [Actinomycetota bacterium]
MRSESRNSKGGDEARLPRRVGVVGAGTMGAGIAQLAALARFDTHLHDPVPEALRGGEEQLRAALAKGADRGRWTLTEAEAASARLRATSKLEDLAGCELVIEAAPEDLELKRELFGRLAAVCGAEAILATNTSSLSVTAISSGLERPERACGMHFFNPPALMRLVEVVAGERTSEQTLAIASEVARAMGREPIRAADAIGFVANRTARPFTLEALRLLGERIATHDQIDRIVRIGGGFRMGPFELMDLVGVDVNFEVAKSFWEQSSHEPRWQPHPLQERLVAAGRLGRKSGRGWYEYEPGPHRPDDPPPPAQDADAVVAEADPERIEGEGFVAVKLEAGSLGALAPGEEGAVGFVALPDLARARLVEVVRGPHTDGRALGAAGRFFADLGKDVECVPGDAPGLVLGRIVCQIVNEAHFAVGQGVATAEDVDVAMRLGFNWPRGPFEWAEAIGPARVVRVLDGLRSELGADRYRVAPLLRRAAKE